MSLNSRVFHPGPTSEDELKKAGKLVLAPEADLDYQVDEVTGAITVEGVTGAMTVKY